MRILLVDFDSKIPNLALMKLSAWHKEKGDMVGLNIKDPDVVKVSVIFQKNRARASAYSNKFPGAKVIYGGPGMYPDVGNIGEAELIKPDYDLYPSEYAQGFTTRGCIRKCPFCLVPKMEGKIEEYQHPGFFADERFKTIMLLDNNLLAAPREWIKRVFGFFIGGGWEMNMTQGFDARLLTEEWAGILKDIKHPKGIHLAWDNIGDEEIILKSIKLLKDAGFNLKQQVSYYVLCGFNTTFEQDLYRCNRLREAGVNAFPMQYHKHDPRLRTLAHNCRPPAYWKMGPLEKRITSHRRDT